MRRRVVREDERELWARNMRDVKPLVPANAPRRAVQLFRATRDDEAKAAARQQAVRITPEQLSRADAPAAPIPAQHHRLPSHGHSLLTAGEMAVALHLKDRVARRARIGTRSQTEIGVRQSGLDSGSWKRLLRGQMAVERRLDLHGMTAQAAFLRLHEFLLGAWREDVRCVEIVTGLGSGPQGGVLRRELPFWLGRDDLRRIVLAATHSHGANHGAVRVLLRKRGADKR